MSIETLRSVISSTGILVGEDTILFRGGYFDGDVDVPSVEALLKEHGLTRVFRKIAQPRYGERIVHPDDVPRKQRKEGDYALWHDFVMIISENPDENPADPA